MCPFNMKKYFIPVLLMLLTLSIAPKADAQKTELYPQAFFDSTIAKSMLAYGKSSIEGVAFTRVKNGYGMRIGKKMIAANTVITLFPVTPYFEEWYSLRKKEEGKKTSVFMSDQAFRWRITVTSDSYGRFKFADMKPGKYFIQAWADYSKSGSYKEYTGSATDGYGRIDYYQYKNYTNNYSDRIEEFVEITRDGQAIEMKLK